jgi:hypothetical protein
MNDANHSRTLPLWRLATPWTGEEWAEIVTFAQRAQIERQAARGHRTVRLESRRAGIGDAHAALNDAMHHEWRARGFEARLRAKADVCLRDLDAAAIDRLCVDSTQTRDPNA